VAYETSGKLNAAKTNAILAPHAFSGDAHAAGFPPGSSRAADSDVQHTGAERVGRSARKWAVSLFLLFWRFTQ